MCWTKSLNSLKSKTLIGAIFVGYGAAEMFES